MLQRELTLIEQLAHGGVLLRGGARVENLDQCVHLVWGQRELNLRLVASNRLLILVSQFV
eukprot:EW711438.1.p3 GENE.EW711438.1~~EW711438.1.p3  ORF type:complete len:60 (-),score=12.52 EW711438.1:144-323(-)